jgi:hypothetical protein
MYKHNALRNQSATSRYVYVSYFVTCIGIDLVVAMSLQSWMCLNAGYGREKGYGLSTPSYVVIYLYCNINMDIKTISYIDWYCYIKKACSNWEVLGKWIVNWKDIEEWIANTISHYEKEWFKARIIFAWSYSRTFFKSLLNSEPAWHWLYFQWDWYIKWFTIYFRRLTKVKLC